MGGATPPLVVGCWVGGSSTAKPRLSSKLKRGVGGWGGVGGRLVMGYSKANNFEPRAFRGFVLYCLQGIQHNSYLSFFSANTFMQE